MAECMYLTSAELSTLTGSGYTVSSGPHDTEIECLIACSGGILVYDTFTGTTGNNMTSHTPDIGPIPTSSDTHYKIKDNKLVNEVLVVTPYKPLVYECSVADISISADFHCGNAFGSFPTYDIPNICLRYTDDNTMILVQYYIGAGGSKSLGVYAVSYPTVVLIASSTSSSLPALGVDFHIEVIANGTAISVKIDTVEFISTTSSHNLTATKHGLEINASQAGSQSTVDELLIVAV